MLIVLSPNALLHGIHCEQKLVYNTESDESGSSRPIITLGGVSQVVFSVTVSHVTVAALKKHPYTACAE